MVTEKMATSRQMSGSSDISKNSCAALPQLDSMTTEDISDLLDQTLEINSALSKETDMFEKFMKRLDPKDMQAKVPVHLSQADLKTTRKKGKSRGSTSGERLQKLTAEQKCDIATRELDELHEEIERKKEDWDKQLDCHQAVVEETKQRMDEIKKHHYEFERDVCRGGVDPRTGNIQAERVVKFFQDGIRSRVALAEKLRLKNSGLRVKRKKLQFHLKQKEESGEVRHEVDFEQLKIENKQFAEKFEARNQELLQLKLKSGNTMQVLNSYKKKLQNLTAESKRLDADMHSRQEMTGRIESETSLVAKERDKAEALNRHLRQKLEDFKVPEVIDYVRERAKVHKLEKDMKTWERKVEIAELSLKSQKQAWSRFKQQHDAQTWNAINPPYAN